MVRKGAAARRCELGGERSMRRNRRHDLIADAAEVRDAVGETLDLEAVPMHAALLVEIVLDSYAYGLTPFQLEHGARNGDRIPRRHDAVLLKEKAVRGLVAEESVRLFLN